MKYSQYGIFFLRVTRQWLARHHYEPVTMEYKIDRNSSLWPTFLYRLRMTMADMAAVYVTMTTNVTNASVIKLLSSSIVPDWEYACYINVRYWMPYLVTLSLIKSLQIYIIYTHVLYINMSYIQQESVI